MAIGDSITEGDGGECSFRKPLSQALLARNWCTAQFLGARYGNYATSSSCAATSTPHEGRSGWRADEVTPIVSSTVARFYPDYVLIHLGSNDVFQGQSVASTISDINNIVDNVLSARPDATVLLAGIIPWSPTVLDNSGVDELAVSYDLAEQTAALVSSRAANGDDIHFVDMRPGFSSATMTYDGVHPNSAGEAHMANAILAALDALNFCSASNPHFTNPKANSTLSGANIVNASWSPGSTAVDGSYWVYAGSAPGQSNYFNSGNLGSATSVDITGLPTDSSRIFLTLYYGVNGVWREVSEAVYASSGGGNTGGGNTGGGTGGTPAISTPGSGGTLSGSTETFTWSANGANASNWWVWLGSSPGGSDYHNSGNLGSTMTLTATGLPTDGSTVYATLWYIEAGSWQSVTDSYTAATSGGGNTGGGTGGTPAISTPGSGGTLSGSTETFTWSANGANASNWWVWLGSSAGGSDYHNSGNLGSATTLTATGLPTDGSTVYATLWYIEAGSWQSVTDSYTAATSGGGNTGGGNTGGGNTGGGTGGTPAISAPGSGGTLSGSTETFTWSANGANASNWWVWLGSSSGGSDYHNSGNLGSATTLTATGLPTDGSTVYATLWYIEGGSWQSVTDSYTAATSGGGNTGGGNTGGGNTGGGTGGTPAISAPGSGGTLSGSTETFTWSANGANASNWWVYVGSNAGANNYFDSGNLGSTTTLNVNGLPTNGSTVHVTLWYIENGVWQSVRSTYQAAGA